MYPTGKVVSFATVVFQNKVDKKLADVGERLKRLREDLSIAEEQCLHFDELANDARIRALVSETPSAERQHRDAARHADTMLQHKVRLRTQIQHLEQQQDRLLDQYYSDV